MRTNVRRGLPNKLWGVPRKSWGRPRKSYGQTLQCTEIQTELNDAYAAWYTAYSKLKQPHTSWDVEAKNEAKIMGKKTLEDFNNQYILYAR